MIDLRMNALPFWLLSLEWWIFFNREVKTLLCECVQTPNIVSFFLIKPVCFINNNNHHQPEVATNITTILINIYMRSYYLAWNSFDWWRTMTTTLMTMMMINFKNEIHITTQTANTAKSLLLFSVMWEFYYYYYCLLLLLIIIITILLVLFVLYFSFLFRHTNWWRRRSDDYLMCVTKWGRMLTRSDVLMERNEYFPQQQQPNLFSLLFRYFRLF